MATRESILGERFQRALRPVVKNFRFSTSTGMVRSSWVRAEIREFSIPVRIPGTGSPIMAPMAMYIRGIRMAMEENSRRFMDFCSSSSLFLRSFHSLRKSFCPPEAASPGREAPYPMPSTVRMIWPASVVFSSKLTCI